MRKILKGICIGLFSISLIMGANANENTGDVYFEIDQSKKETLFIHLKSEQSFLVTHYFLENGKTLHIGYEKKGSQTTEYTIEIDPQSAILPIKVVLMDIDRKDHLPFEDLYGVESAPFVKHLYDAGIVKGMPDGLFHPFASLTRAEFMTILIKALKLKPEKNHDMGRFRDVEGHWAYSSLQTAHKSGMISGYEDNTMRPDDPITLAEASSIINRAFSFKTKKNGLFVKLKSGEWYSNAVRRLFESTVLQEGDALYQSFDEKRTINRAECAMMMSRSLTTF
jgi:hypothetical protein